MERRKDQRIEPLDNKERTKCEVWSRVMGYHRPIIYYNLGKQQEHRDRRFFIERTDKPFDAMAPSTRNI